MTTLKMPVSTMKYFAAQKYQHFQMTGKNANQSTFKTMHLNDDGERVELYVSLYIHDRVAVVSWYGNQRIAGARQLETRQFPIARSWGI